MGIMEKKVERWGGSKLRFRGLKGLDSILPPLSNSCIISIIWLYIALNRTPNIALNPKPLIGLLI